MKFSRFSRGDTIVEILISIAILSFIMTMSYTLANRSIQGVRQAQERSEAQKIAETQIESLKIYLANPGATLSAVGGEFCLKIDGSNLVKVDIPTSPGASVPSDCMTGPDSRYTSVIKRVADGVYSANLSWQRADGQGSDQLITWYKVYGSNGYAALDLSGIMTDTEHTGACRTLEMFDPTVNGGEGGCVTTCSAGSHENTPGGLCVPDVCPGGEVLGVGRISPTEECVPDYCSNITGWQNPTVLKAGVDQDVASKKCSISINPNSYYLCQDLEYINDSAKGCQTPSSISPAMFAYRNIKAYYKIDTFPAEAIGKPMTIKITYSQYNNNWPPVNGYTSNWAPSGYNYKIDAYPCRNMDTGQCIGARDISVPAKDPGVQSTYETQVGISSNVTDFTFRWKNNKEGDGYAWPIDANLQIDKIILTW